MWYFTRSNLLGRAGGFTRSFENLHLCPPPTLHFVRTRTSFSAESRYLSSVLLPVLQLVLFFRPKRRAMDFPLALGEKDVSAYQSTDWNPSCIGVFTNFIFAGSYFYLKRFIKNPGGLYDERGRHSLMSLVLSVTGFVLGK